MALRRLSSEFFCLLGGVALTLFSWYGPWSWPAAPALFLLDTIFKNDKFSDLPYRERALAMTFLIVWNVCFWAVVFRALLWVVERVRRREPGGRNPA